jgi:hypothetical protein
MTTPTPAARLREAVEILRKHNEWRRGAVIPQESPGVIGAAIDVVCELVPLILRDQDEAAGELLVNMMECAPGTTCGKLLEANVIIRHQRDAARADAERLAEALAAVVAVGIGYTGTDCGRGGGDCRHCEDKDEAARAALAAHDQAKEGRT